MLVLGVPFHFISACRHHIILSVLPPKKIHINTGCARYVGLQMSSLHLPTNIHNDTEWNIDWSSETNNPLRNNYVWLSDCNKHWQTLQLPNIISRRDQEFSHVRSGFSEWSGRDKLESNLINSSSNKNLLNFVLVMLRNPLLRQLLSLSRCQFWSHFKWTKLLSCF